MPATMEEVARHAAVSTATVSRVLNHPHLVNPETRQLVISAIEALGYRVNSSARSLRTSQTYMVAAVVDNLSNHTTILFLEALEAKLVKAGYSLQVCLVHHHQARVMHYLHELTQEGQVDGILWMTDYTDPQIEDKLTLNSRHNVLLIDGGLRHTPTTHYQSLTLDYAEAFYQATQYLIGLGHCRIGLLNLAEQGQTRQQGYLQALQEHHLAPIIGYAKSMGMEDWQLVAEQLVNVPNVPSAILAFDDTAAAQVYRVAAQRGLKIPTELSVIGCGNVSIATYLTPPLTTFGLPIETLAEMAVQQLLNSTTEAFHQHYPLTLIERASVAAF